MNYIGSKLSLLDFIEETVNEVAGNNSDRIFCDLFAGTGVVGSHFREMGYMVYSNDIQYYSFVLNRNLIKNIPPMDISLIEGLNNCEPIEGFIYKNYCAGSGSGRNYFTDENGKKCDAIRQKLEYYYCNNKINDDQYFFALASLINSADKVANTAVVYSSFLKHIKYSAQKELNLIPVLPPSGPKGKVFCEDSNSLIYHISGDILYLDPPYNERQFGSNYHLLETIAKYDSPVVSGATGLRNWSETKSDWCSKKTAVKTLADIIKNADFKYIFLSYNNEGIIPSSDIKKIFEQYGKYLCSETPYHRLITHKDKPFTSTMEYIHCLVKE